MANYPLTPEDFERLGLPPPLEAHRAKLRGLTLAPERLAEIRSERRPASRYADPETCRTELCAAEALMHNEGILCIDTTHCSVEEIAARLKLSMS